MKRTAAEYEESSIKAGEDNKWEESIVCATLAVAAQLDKIEDKLHDLVNRQP